MARALTSSVDASREPAVGRDAAEEIALAAEALKLSGCFKRSAEERETVATRLFDRLHPMMAVLGLLFLVVVLAQAGARTGTALHSALVIASWLLWVAFVSDYLLRFLVACDRRSFVKRTWWQLLFLAIPFLSMLRGLLFLKLARPTRVVLAAVRGTRSASRRLSSRLGWLALVTTIVIFSAADLLYQGGGIRPYGAALHAAALGAVAGHASQSGTAVGQVLDVFLALYSVVVFAALAGALGVFFMERRGEQALTVATPTGVAVDGAGAGPS